MAHRLTICSPAVTGASLGRRVHSNVGHLGQPRVKLGVEGLQVGEGAPFQEAPLDVSDGPLHLALGARPVRRAGEDIETPVIGEGGELPLDHRRGALGAGLSHHLLEVVEQQLARDTAKGVKGPFQKLHEHPAALGNDKAGPDHPGVAEHDHQQAQPAAAAAVHDGAARGPVDLGLPAGLGLESVHEPLDVTLLDARHNLPEDGDATVVTHPTQLPQEGRVAGRSKRSRRLSM